MRPRRLNTLLPMTLPTETPTLPRRRATTETANSGAEVPAATTVPPMTHSEMPAARASDDAEAADEEEGVAAAERDALDDPTGDDSRGSLASFAGSRLPEQVAGVGDEEADENQPLPPRHRPVEEGSDGDERAREEGRAVAVDQPPPDWDGSDERDQAEDEGEVEQTRPDDVPDRDVAESGEGGVGRDDEFR